MVSQLAFDHDRATHSSIYEILADGHTERYALTICSKSFELDARPIQISLMVQISMLQIVPDRRVVLSRLTLSPVVASRRSEGGPHLSRGLRGLRSANFPLKNAGQLRYSGTFVPSGLLYCTSEHALAFSPPDAHHSRHRYPILDPHRISIVDCDTESLAIG